MLVLDVQAQTAEKAHIRIGNPNQAEPGDQKTTPTGKKQLKVAQKHKGGGDIVAETVFAGEEIEKLS